MKKMLTNSWLLGLLLLILFRLLLLLLMGPSRDGNFLILVIVPFFGFTGIVYLSKKLLGTPTNK